MKDYYDLARLSEQREYINKLLDLAAEEKSTYYLFQAPFAVLLPDGGGERQQKNTGIFCRKMKT
jgi:hypothetical protein